MGMFRIIPPSAGNEARLLLRGLVQAGIAPDRTHAKVAADLGHLRLGRGQKVFCIGRHRAGARHRSLPGHRRQDKRNARQNFPQSRYVD